ncbi:NUDIX hydrolase [Zhihengliuella salsuginis]|uniref:ADP-ribose pyrophosphatase n=1 Tax=Zhihengliuella salsuginis TaxID=578222 RepID=A0ABQ3GI74_9MICC|nr:NUDIX domain-containing protein [Zhihengliuella salsuginis]GHD08359.1 ADP-ribose pyrophosphatase [Zhihengliuella salsuginis]
MEFLNVSERAATSPELAVSTVIFSLRRDRGADEDSPLRLWIPLVRRTRQPYRGQWALPGGPLAAEQSLQSAAAENLRTTTGLVPRYLEQLYAFGGTDRSPARRVVSIVYWALVRQADTSGARDDRGAPHSELIEDPNVAWFPVDSPEVREQLAFDHGRIVEYALWRLRNKVTYGKVAHRLLGDRFTLAQVREVYEVVLDTTLDPANFRRQLKGSPGLVETGEHLHGVKHRPPKLYRYEDPVTALPAPAPAATASPQEGSRV